MSDIKKISSFLNGDEIKKKFTEVLGKNSSSFLSSILTICNQSDLLQAATPQSIYSSALMGATLNLPLNPQLGFAYILPFNNRKKGVQEAQFQIGYKGYIQLAMRSGQFKTIAGTPIYQGQLIEENPLTGFVFDFSVKKQGDPIGYASFFELLNGFSKTLYLTTEEVTAHGKKYSQTFKKGYGLWKDDFDGMSLKTVIKLLLSKYAPLSIDMQRAIISDSSVIEDVDTLDVSYVDNQTLSLAETQADQEKENLIEFINDAIDIETLSEVETEVEKYGMKEIYEEKKTELSK